MSCPFLLLAYLFFKVFQNISIFQMQKLLNPCFNHANKLLIFHIRIGVECLGYSVHTAKNHSNVNIIFVHFKSFPFFLHLHPIIYYSLKQEIPYSNKEIQSGGGGMSGSLIFLAKKILENKLYLDRYVIYPYCTEWGL